jgi:hypothetical protein
VGKRGTESPAIAEQLMEEVCERENCKQALKRVKANKGSAGMEGMTVQQLPAYLKQHWPAIRKQLLGGIYNSQPLGPAIRQFRSLRVASDEITLSDWPCRRLPRYYTCAGPTLSDLLTRKAALSPEMGLRIEKAFGPDMNEFDHAILC